MTVLVSCTDPVKVNEGSYVPPLLLMMKSVVVAPSDCRDEMSSGSRDHSDARTETWQMNDLGFITRGEMRERGVLKAFL